MSHPTAENRSQKVVSESPDLTGYTQTTGKIKILIVEDELPLAFLMVAALTRVGCDVEAVHNGKKALKLASENKFDLIALDIKLPDASGFDLCSELKQRHISRNTPIIFVSGSISPEDIAESKRRGGVDYFTKPFDMTDFIYKAIFYAKVESKQIAIPAGWKNKT